MKKIVSMLLLVTMILLLAACGGKAPTAPAKPAESAGESIAENKDKDGKKAPTYKETMVPFDQLTPAKRIVLLQGALNFTREGFYTKDNKPASEKIEYNGCKVDAYPMSYPLAFLTNDIKGDLTVTNNDGSSKTVSAKDFAGLYVIIDFTSDAPPVLYNPETGTEITDFLFATTAEGEAIYSVVSGSTHNAAEVITGVGWDAKASYRYVAADKFYIPVVSAENASGEIRGALSGAVNGSFPEVAVAKGKINDLVFIQVME